MPNVKCILRDALYIGVFLGASIFGHVEKAFLKIFFVSCYNIELLILPWILDCEVGSWILNAKFSKKIFAEKFLVKKICRKHLQINFWKKYF